MSTDELTDYVDLMRRVRAKGNPLSKDEMARLQAYIKNPPKLAKVEPQRRLSKRKSTPRGRNT